MLLAIYNKKSCVPGKHEFCTKRTISGAAWCLIVILLGPHNHHEREEDRRVTYLVATQLQSTSLIDFDQRTFTDRFNCQILARRLNKYNARFLVLQLAQIGLIVRPSDN
jgi:hypothetical protein